MLPELARIFLSSDEMVAFDPTGPEDEELFRARVGARGGHGNRHALHGLLSDVTYPMIAGTSVLTDWVPILNSNSR